MPARTDTTPDIHETFETNAAHAGGELHQISNVIIAEGNPDIAREHPEVYYHPETRYPERKL